MAGRLGPSGARWWRRRSSPTKPSTGCAARSSGWPPLIDDRPTPGTALIQPRNGAVRLSACWGTVVGVEKRHRGGSARVFRRYGALPASALRRCWPVQRNDRIQPASAGGVAVALAARPAGTGLWCLNTQGSSRRRRAHLAGLRPGRRMTVGGGRQRYRGGAAQPEQCQPRVALRTTFNSSLQFGASDLSQNSRPCGSCLPSAPSESSLKACAAARPKAIARVKGGVDTPVVRWTALATLVNSFGVWLHDRRSRVSDRRRCSPTRGPVWNGVASG